MVSGVPVWRSTDNVFHPICFWADGQWWSWSEAAMAASNEPAPEFCCLSFRNSHCSIKISSKNKYIKICASFRKNYYFRKSLSHLQEKIQSDIKLIKWNHDAEFLGNHYRKKLYYNFKNYYIEVTIISTIHSSHKHEIMLGFLVLLENMLTWAHRHQYQYAPVPCESKTVKCEGNWSRQKRRCTTSHIWSLGYAYVLNVPYKGSWCTVGLCSAQSYGIMWSRDPSPLHPRHSSPSSMPL